MLTVVRVHYLPNQILAIYHTYAVQHVPQVLGLGEYIFLRSENKEGA